MLSEHKICSLYWEFNGNLSVDFPQGGSSCPLFPTWIGILNVGFCGGRNTRRPRWKTLGARMRTNGQFLPLCDTCSEIKLRPKYHPSSPSPLYKLFKKRKKKKKKEEKGLMLNWHVTAACPVPPLPSFSYPFNSHEWPRQNFSLQYQYNVNQISDENKEKYQLGDN